MALNKYTQADVEALTDAELDELAGFLQGWTIGGDCEANHYWIDAEGEHTGLYVWWRMGRSYSPSHDRNRSGELLQFAAHKMGMEYTFVSDLQGQKSLSDAKAADTLSNIDWYKLTPCLS